MTYYNRTHHYPANDQDAYVVETSRGYIVMVDGAEVDRARSLDTALARIETLELKAEEVAA